MFKLKQKTKTASLSLALAAAMTGGVMMGTSTSVEAINIAQDGLGEVLIFPYYTTRGGWQSYFNITNTSERTVLIKVRWHEGVNSRDARDFIVALSPHDVWTAAVIPSVDKATGKPVARVVTSDKSCTAPALANKEGDRDNVTGVDFTNLAYTGKNADGGATSLDRTMEGYFTVFAMGTAKQENNNIIDPPKRDLPDGEILTISEAVRHTKVDGNNNEGVPVDCRFFTEEFEKLDKGKETLLKNKEVFAERELGEFHEPNNVLRGRAILINAASGIAMGYDPTVMANYFNPTEFGPYAGLDSDNPLNIIQKPEDLRPNLDQALPAVASWIDDTPGASIALQEVSASEARASHGIGYDINDPLGFDRSVDAVSVLFNRAAIVNDYNIAGGSKTDWIVTLPTKRFYVDNMEYPGIDGSAAASEQAAIPGEIAPIPPFDVLSVNGEAFNKHGVNLPHTGQSCFDVSMKIWDREEGELTPPGGLNFSPPPAPGEANKFCYEANIITFGETDPVGDFEDEVTGATKSSSNVMGSHLSKAFTQLSGDYGWAQLEFGAGGGQSLPVIGVRLETRKKENNPSASYGFANAHSYKRNVEAYTELPRWENQFDRSIPQLPTDGR